MQIIHWLFKGSIVTGSRSHNEQCRVEEGEQVKCRDLVVYEERVDDEVEAKNTFTLLLKREDSRASFCSTLQLKRPDSLRYDCQQKPWQTATCDRGPVEARHKADAAVAGCMVLPICHRNADCREGSDKETQKRRRPVSRMKELMKWAAAAKTKKGGIKGWKVLYFRNKMALKDSLDGTSASSRNISFRWDMGSCSTSSSVFLPMSMPTNLSRKCSALQTADSITSSLGNSKREECNKAGQWITSDSDFVVLEL